MEAASVVDDKSKPARNGMSRSTDTGIASR